MNVRDYDHSDDMFTDTRMSFGEHIEELRTHLIRAIVGFGVAMGISFFLGQPVLDYIILPPVEEQLKAVYDRRANMIIKAILDEPRPAETKFVKVLFLKKDLEAAFKQEQPAEEPQPPPKNVDPADTVRLWMAYDDPRLAYIDLWGEVAKKLGPRPTMKTMNVTEAFIVYFKVSIYCGLVLASPWIFYQLWAFVAAGLYPHEKRYIHVYLPLSLGLF
ncbi:MAG TPA: twin-arginine translocase subunit TatC, partial [Gemmataceae bacterium]|nr:twin-arginine translocase subunit TatC [Gemmataceae bacterium]